MPVHLFFVEIFQKISKYIQQRGVKKIYGDTPGAPGDYASLPDMVVIEFDVPFDLKPGVVEPACLPTQEIPVGSLCYTSGWGSLGQKLEPLDLGFPIELQVVDVKISNMQGFMTDSTVGRSSYFQLALKLVL